MSVSRIKNKLRELKSSLKLVFYYYIEAKTFFFLLVKHNASILTNKNQTKMQFTLLRENHVIEKGMSMKNPRIGFGQKKVTVLLQKLDYYHKRYHDSDFLFYPLSTIRSYIQFTKQTEVSIPSIEKKFEELCVDSGIFKSDTKGGIKNISKFDIWTKSKINFPDFVNTRHSIRYFSNEIPSIDLINQALTSAQRTPSACNRQAWKAYIYSRKKTCDLLKWQEGANGFEKDIPLSILVTSNLNAFLSHEPHQAYVDGGMYAMSLIYALHSLGFGTIPFSTGFQSTKIKKMHQLFGIPENEIPVVIVGVGVLLDNFTVAVSERKPIAQTTIYNLE